MHAQHLDTATQGIYWKHAKWACESSKWACEHGIAKLQIDPIKKVFKTITRHSVLDGTVWNVHVNVKPHNSSIFQWHNFAWNVNSSCSAVSSANLHPCADIRVAHGNRCFWKYNLRVADFYVFNVASPMGRGANSTVDELYHGRQGIWCEKMRSKIRECISWRQGWHAKNEIINVWWSRVKRVSIFRVYQENQSA